MAGALVKGWVSSGLIPASQVVIQQNVCFVMNNLNLSMQVLASVPEQDSALLDPLRELGCETTHNNLDTVNNSDVILLGVKPFVVPLVAKELKNKGQGQLLISVAAGQRNVGQKTANTH